MTSSLATQRRLVVTGDDFGFSPQVNQGILQAHLQGVLTSASLMVTGAAVEEAVELAHRHPSLAVGLHLVLTQEKAVLPPEQIPHLVNPEGYFNASPLVAGLRYQFVPQARQELSWEVRAQLEKFRRTGLPLSHVDGHMHLHCHPVVLDILAQVAGEFGIRVVRLPLEEVPWESGLWLPDLLLGKIFARLRRHGEKIFGSQGVRLADRVYGLQATGRINEAYLLDLIPRLQGDLIEVYTHPALGHPAAGEHELLALVSERVRATLEGHGFALTNFLEAVL